MRTSADSQYLLQIQNFWFNYNSHNSGRNTELILDDYMQIMTCMKC